MSSLENVLTPLAKNVLIPLALKAASSPADIRIYKNYSLYRNKNFNISNGINRRYYENN